jgi:Cd2+/Zn2+-exporting ATPase
MTSVERQTRFRIGGMDCAACAAKIETAARRIPGVQDVSVSVAAGTMVVRHGEKTDLAALQRAIHGLGYEITPVDADRPAGKPRHDHKHDALEGTHGHDHAPSSGPWWKSSKGLLTIASAVGLAIAYGVAHVIPSLGTWPFIVAMSIGLAPIAQRAFMAALAGSPFSIEMLMSVAAAGAVIIGATEEAATVVLLLSRRRVARGCCCGKGARQHSRAREASAKNCAG